ncbi:hypothetical protein [Williamsia sp. D3]|nr:hypothetical protein [Williamsia sp. D3]ETD30647.1 hypothetical protein W823_23855 [Williamsia sp. D3]
MSNPRLDPKRFDEGRRRDAGRPGSHLEGEPGRAGLRQDGVGCIEQVII